MTPAADTRLGRLERSVRRSLGRRRALGAIALGGFLPVFVLGLLIDEPDEPGIVLYAIPVALLALALGTWVGTLGGILGGTLYWLAGWYHDAELSAAAISYRVAALVILGALIGSLANRLDNAELDAQRLLELAHEGVWTLDGEGRTTYVNPKLAELLGTTQAELLRSPPSRWLAPGEPLAERLAARRRGMTEEYEAKLLRANGTELWASVAAAPITDRRGRPRGSLALIADVTERRRAEEELRRSETGLAEAQRIAQLGSWEWDVRGDRIAWSAELHRIYGVEPGEFDSSYEGYLARVHPDDRERVDRVVRSSFETQAPFSFSHRAIRPDGTVRVVDSRGDVFVEDGQIVRMAGTAHDVTERAEAEEKLAVAAELRRRAVELNDTVVQGLAVARYRLGDDGSEAATAVTTALAGAKELVEDLLGDEPPVPGSLRRESAAGGAFTPFGE